MEIPFIKLEANGNNFLLIQNKCLNKNLKINHLVTKMTNKNYGIYSDGILILNDNYRPIPYVDIYNNDGSKASLCINGIRIVAKYLFSTKYHNKDNIKIKTESGIYEVQNSLDNIIVKIKIPNTLQEDDYYYQQKKYHLYFLNIGNNHVYLINNNGFINERYFKKILGKHLSEQFDSNIGLITPIGSNFFSIITYERGSKVTLSCGSNICGATYLLKELKLVRENEDINVETLGGNLTVKINNDEVLYIGIANLICKGVYYL